MGEPISDEEARDAVHMIAQGSGDVITFDDFALYWNGSHATQQPTKAGGVRSARDQKNEWYRTRFKFVKARLPNASIGKVFTETEGPVPSLEWRMRFYYADGPIKVPISPWHDIPLQLEGSCVNFLCEIPKWSRRKYEIATGEGYNPIKQDVRNASLREYTWGDMLFNYGALPQTWEDPSHRSEDTNAFGDNDPLDLVEVGTKMWPTGSIVRVKILGVLGLIDAGETDWKVIGISVEDPLAPLLNDVDDLEVHVPGLVEALHRWLQLYKSPVINTFAFDGKAQGREYAIELVRETHSAWQRLMGEAEGGKADGGIGGLKVVSAGMTRSTSNTRLAALLGASN